MITFEVVKTQRQARCVSLLRKRCFSFSTRGSAFQIPKKWHNKSWKSCRRVPGRSQTYTDSLRDGKLPADTVTWTLQLSSTISVLSSSSKPVSVGCGSSRFERQQINFKNSTWAYSDISKRKKSSAIAPSHALILRHLCPVSNLTIKLHSRKFIYLLPHRSVQPPLFG